jgi:hypothetical protein
LCKDTTISIADLASSIKKNTFQLKYSLDELETLVSNFDPEFVGHEKSPIMSLINLCAIVLKLVIFSPGNLSCLGLLNFSIVPSTSWKTEALQVSSAMVSKNEPANVCEN